MKIAKLILHFNTPELTDKLCEAVPDAIVVDNGSTPAYSGKNTCIRLDANYGFTRGWNKAITELYSQYDAFWLMNSDIEITQESIEAVEKLIANDDIDILTLSYNSWMPDLKTDAARGLIEVDCIEFTAPVIKRKVFEKIGLFDEGFTFGYGVEFDFCHQARQAGFKIMVDHTHSFHHIGQQTINSNEGIDEYSKIGNFELIRGLRHKYGAEWRTKTLGKLAYAKFPVRIAVYTAIFGDFNDLKPVPKQTVDADYFCITDNPNTKAPGWKTIVVKTPRPDLHPRIRAKFYKIFPWECNEIAGYPISIYFDGSIKIESSQFVEHCLANLWQDMLLYKHPERTCIYDERVASNALKKYKTELVNEQVAFYSKFHPKKFGLYACGVLVRRHTDFMRRLMHQWWFEIIKWSYQDQLSFPVICRLNNFEPSTFNENQYHNDYFKIFWHDDGVKDKQLRNFNSNEPISISVLMPIYNTPIEFVREAVKSILNQSRADFQLVIVDDNNHDPYLLNYFKNLRNDNRVKIVSTTCNKGLAAALNVGLEACDGNLVVRMDSDDIAHPDLLKQHFLYFYKNKDAVVCGVQIKAFNDGSFVSNHPDNITARKAYDRTGHWFVNHPGVAYKRDIILQLGGYGNVPANCAEDYELWCRVLKAGFVINNQPSVLLKYRVIHKPERKTEQWKQFLDECKKTLL